MGWKHPHFIPQDLWLVAFFLHEDGLDIVEAMMRWGLTSSDGEVERAEHFTLQQFVDLIKEKVAEL